MYQLASVFTVLSYIILPAVATPKLGIRADYLEPVWPSPFLPILSISSQYVSHTTSCIIQQSHPRDIHCDSADCSFIQSGDPAKDRLVQSYSGIIKCEDASIPLDGSQMTDARLYHLAVLAYKEMFNIWEPRLLGPDALPNAMAVMASGDTLYFASSIRCSTYITRIRIEDVAQGPVRQYMDNALQSVGTHRHRGGCAEINLLELYWTQNGHSMPGPPNPRVAITKDGKYNVAPCTRATGSGYGCHDIVRDFGLDPINSNVQADASKQDDWQFSLQHTVRPPCSTPWD